MGYSTYQLVQDFSHQQMREVNGMAKVQQEHQHDQNHRHFIFGSKTTCASNSSPTNVFQREKLGTLGRVPEIYTNIYHLYIDYVMVDDFHEIIHTKTNMSATYLANHYQRLGDENKIKILTRPVAKELRVKILRCALYQPDKVRQSLCGKHEEPIFSNFAKIYTISTLCIQKREYLICVYLDKPKCI